MKTIKKLKKEERGSILILTMLALVGAISIAVAMSSISIVERKITTKSRKSTTAFQSANSGIEWAMKKINDADVKDDGSGDFQTINDVFGISPNSNGQISCPNNTLFSNGSGLECKITFLKRNTTTGERDLITADAPMEDIVAIRSSGTFGSDTEQVGRALEAYAMPNCGDSATRVADFCIDNADKDNVNSWGAAVSDCESAGKRLCTAAELVAANQISTIDINDVLSSDVTGDKEYAIVKQGNIDSVVTDSSIDTNTVFRCCRNR